MATSEILEQLEACAQIIMAQPDRVTANDRSNAEQVFINFQKTKNPFEMCREILEYSQNQYILFQAGACLKNAVIREWSTLGKSGAHALFNYLFEYVNRCPLDQFVINELMLVSAVIFKRFLLHDYELLEQTNEISGEKIVISLYEIINNENSSIATKLNTCTLIIQILNQTFNHDDYALSWYSHFIVKKIFQSKCLLNIFKFTIEVLFKQLKLSEMARQTPDWIKFNLKLFQICEVILHEDFCLISNFFNEKNRYLVEYILEQDVISLFFQLYIISRTLDPTLLQTSLSCLTQLSTMVPNTTTNSWMKISEIWIINITSLCDRIINVITIDEIIFLANIFNAIMVHLRTFSLKKCFDSSLYKNFIDHLIKYTCKVMMESVKFKTNSDEDVCDKCNRSIEYLLNAFSYFINIWNYVIEELQNDQQKDGVNMNQFITNDQMIAYSQTIFKTYVQIHLSEPEGLLPLSCFQDTEEIQEFEESDDTLFESQILAIGRIAQVDLLNTVNTLTQLLVMKLQQFESIIMSNSQDNIIQWTRVSEDIHWLLMISGDIFICCTENEIPTQVVKLSIKYSGDIQATAEALEKGDYNAPNIDPVVRYFIVIFKFILMEKQLMENNMLKWISPQVSYTLSQFISRWMNVYLVPAEYEYDTSEISLTLNTCFGADSPYAKNVLNFLLDHLERKFFTMSSELAVLEKSTDGLKIFCRFPNRIKLLQECSSLQRLFQHFTVNSNYRNLNSSIRRNIFYIFSIVFVQNYNVLLEQMRSLYLKFCKDKALGKEGITCEQFMLIIDFILGMCNGVSLSKNQLWNSFILPVYMDLPQIMKSMINNNIVVQAILKLINKLYFSLCTTITPDDNLIYLDNTMKILYEYATLNKNNYSKDPTRLEELKTELVLVFKFLNEISSDNTIFILEYNLADNENVSKVLSKKMQEISVTTFNLLLPLINDQLLEDETFCSNYFKLLEFLSHEKNNFQDDSLLECFARSVEYAFKATNISNDTKIAALNILVELANQMKTNLEQSQKIENYLRTFFHTIMQFIICDLVFDNDQKLCDSVALSFYSLIQCFNHCYKEIIEQVMHGIGDVNTEQRICKALFNIIEKHNQTNSNNCAQMTNQTAPKSLNGLNSRMFNRARGTGDQFKVEFSNDFTEFVKQLHTMLPLR